jgi:hypothetical protein
MNGTCTNEHAGWFRDVHRLLDVTQVTPGLPLPSVSKDLAAFNYTSITHDRDAAQAVADAETVLSYALRVNFEPRRPDPVGTATYYILSAYMPSGLRVDIVARARVFDGQDAPRELEDVAA